MWMKCDIKRLRMLVSSSSDGRTSLKGKIQITLTVNRSLQSHCEGKERRSEPVLSVTECHLPSSVLGQRWALENHAGAF